MNRSLSKILICPSKTLLELPNVLAWLKLFYTLHCMYRWNYASFPFGDWVWRSAPVRVWSFHRFWVDFVHRVKCGKFVFKSQGVTLRIQGGQMPPPLPNETLYNTQVVVDESLAFTAFTESSLDTKLHISKCTRFKMHKFNKMEYIPTEECTRVVH